MATGDTPAAEGRFRIISVLNRLFSIEALTYFWAWVTGATNIVLPRPREAFEDHQAIHAWEDRLVNGLKNGLGCSAAERQLQDWGFEFNRYRREDLAPSPAHRLMASLPEHAQAMLLAGRVVGEPGSVQPHLRVLVFLDGDDRVCGLRTEVIHV